MKVAKVQFHKLDKEYFFLPEFTEPNQAQVRTGDRVVVETTLGRDIGLVTALAEWQPSDRSKEETVTKPGIALEQNDIADIKPMLRLATEEDLAAAHRQISNYSKYIKKCRELCREHELKAMKLVDVAESFDNKRLTFYFVSDGRVDFRELVKDLVKSFHRKIRLQQIGVRDATKLGGDVGPCGLPLCCNSWMNTIGNVSPEYIKDQELTHRGADRLTGPCGRLKCCLRFEEEVYRYKRNQMPKEGEIIKTGAGRGRVVSVHPMKQTVNLEINGAIVEYPYLEGKVCEENPDSTNKGE